MAQTTGKRPTTDDRNQTLSISIPESIIERLKTRADAEMRTVSSMAAFILKTALDQKTTEN
jgi:CopG-like RHH_1 or ribbon-helix-helix domain, RHH_5